MLFIVYEAKDAAPDKAPIVTGWEPHGEHEYRAVAVREAESAPNLDMVI